MNLFVQRGIGWLACMGFVATRSLAGPVGLSLKLALYCQLRGPLAAVLARTAPAHPCVPHARCLPVRLLYHSCY
jgi:hypothetical protein